MMLHQQCIQHGCHWNSITSLSIEPPKFAIGSFVSCDYQSEAGPMIYCWGQVMGIFPAPPMWLTGWWYVVRWDVMDGIDYLAAPHSEDCHESELEFCTKRP